MTVKNIPAKRLAKIEHRLDTHTKLLWGIALGVVVLLLH